MDRLSRIADHGSRARQRGAALLLVITSIAVVTALTVDLAYNARVSVQLAANARDELKAYYLARSGVNLARLVLYFQHQMDAPLGQAQGLARAAPLAGMSLSLRLWDLVPIDAQTLAFLGGAWLPPLILTQVVTALSLGASALAILFAPRGRNALTTERKIFCRPYRQAK